jgi:hypothetical protein
VLHGDWTRCLNTNFGDRSAGLGVFLDPPYRGFTDAYKCEDVAAAVEIWCRENHAGRRVVLCGHSGDYPSLDWECVSWERPARAYASTPKTEALWFSPACLAGKGQLGMFGEAP